ncbi:MAG: integrase [Bacteroidota bacterium]
MMGSLYNALVQAGVGQDEAAKAAEEVASYENRIAKIEVDLAVLKWMVGFNIATTVTILVRSFF